MASRSPMLTVSTQWLRFNVAFSDDERLWDWLRAFLTE